MSRMALPRQRGFTLIEVLIALFILSGGIIVLASAWSGNFMRIRKSVTYHDVATLLERKMLETEAKYKSKQMSEIPEDDSGDFGSEYKQYRWTMQAKDLKFPDLAPLLTSQEGGADETLISMIKQMTEYLNQTIKEVKISIFVKGTKGKETEFSAVQYIINYEKDFAGLPAGAGAPAAAPAPGGGG